MPGNQLIFLAEALKVVVLAAVVNSALGARVG